MGWSLVSLRILSGVSESNSTADTINLVGLSLDSLQDSFRFYFLSGTAINLEYRLEREGH